MKRRISITLPSSLLRKVDQLAARNRQRSAFIEQVLGAFFQERNRCQVHARDVERINAAADRLNREAADVLKYQA